MTNSIQAESTPTAKRSPTDAFAVWITGLPASGKSTITAALVDKLRDRGLEVVVLESDVLRRVLPPGEYYGDRERDAFYESMVYIAELFIGRGIPVLLDATANRSRYREHARGRIAKFIEVFVDCPLEVCVERDPKGIYRKAIRGEADTVPGLQTAYEPPADADIVVFGDVEAPERAADRILAKIEEKGYLDE